MFEINTTKPTEDRLKETEQVKTSKEYIIPSCESEVSYNAAIQEIHSLYKNFCIQYS